MALTVEFSQFRVVGISSKICFSSLYQRIIKLSNLVSPSFDLSILKVIVADSKLVSEVKLNGSPIMAYTSLDIASIPYIFSMVRFLSRLPFVSISTLISVIASSLVDTVCFFDCPNTSSPSSIPLPFVSGFNGSK